MSPATETERYTLAAWILMGCALLFVLLAHLLPALLAGLLVHELVRVISERISLKPLKGRKAKIVTVAVLAIVVVSLLIAGFMALAAFLRSEAGSVSALLNRLAAILDSSRHILPEFVREYIQGDTRVLRQNIANWLREHAAEVQGAGKEAAVIAARILVGMILGGLIALHEAASREAMRPLAAALAERVTRFSHSFRSVVFAQVRIALINASFTWLYLGVALPMMGVHLPLLKTMVALTFLFGLIPVVGNLVSNTIIVIVSLSVSLQLALVSLGYLIAIHKLEYFLNAKIVGAHIRAHIWEILLVMLAMEAVFGVAGVVAAPIYYAYLKNELTARKLI